MERKYPKSVIPMSDGGRVVKTNCFECHSKCGVLVYVNGNEEVYRVTGNPEDPRTRGTICTKGHAGKKILYHPERVNYPLKRVGEKGEGKWERISWNEAMETIASKLLEYKEKYGPESIVLGQGTGRGTNQWNVRLGKSIGMNHLCAPAHICLFPALITSMITCGFFPVWDGNDYSNSNCIVLWGGNPIWTEGATSAVPIADGRRKGARVIVVDPHFEHPMAHKADYWLPVQPGTDGALALAFLNVIINEDLYDRDFVEKWTNASQLVDAETLEPILESMIREDGEDTRFVVWDQKTKQPVGAKTEDIEPAIEGTFEITRPGGERRTVRTAWSFLLERVAPYTPEKAAGITNVNADLIRDAARLYGKSSPGACLNFMQGLEEHLNCTSAMRDLLCLIAITGNLDVAGGNVWIPFWNEMFGTRLTGQDPPIQEEKKLGRGAKLYPLSLPSAVWKAILTEDPYPIKALIIFAGNPLSSCEDPKYIEQALRKVDFMVVHEYFLSPTAELADIVLPSAHWLERDYIADELTGRYYFAQQRAIDPLYERKSCITLMRELGRMIAPDWWPWESDEELFDFQLEINNITWKELLDKWVYKYAPEVYRNYEKNGFDTPSGLVEIYSNVLASVGSDPLPSYVPAVSPTAEYPFIIMTGRRYPNFYHSAFRNISWLRALTPHPMVDINPQAAKELDIEDGDLVWIESRDGKIQMFARLTNAVHPRNLSAAHGWQQGCKELDLPDYPNHISNVNALINRTDCNPEFGTPNLRSLPVKIYKAEKSEIPGFPYLNVKEKNS